MNSFLELAESRYSVRKYEERQIEEDKLARILRAGQIAPTGANRQPQRILVLQSPEAIEKVRKLTRDALVRHITCRQILNRLLFCRLDILRWDRQKDGMIREKRLMKQ